MWIAKKTITDPLMKIEYSFFSSFFALFQFKNKLVIDGGWAFGVCVQFPSWFMNHDHYVFALFLVRHQLFIYLFINIYRKPILVVVAVVVGDCFRPQVFTRRFYSFLSAMLLKHLQLFRCNARLLPAERVPITNCTVYAVIHQLHQCTQQVRHGNEWVW